MKTPLETAIRKACRAVRSAASPVEGGERGRKWPSRAIGERWKWIEA